jgi:hypothetical protein
MGERVENSENEKSWKAKNTETAVLDQDAFYLLQEDSVCFAD